MVFQFGFHDVDQRVYSLHASDVNMMLSFTNQFDFWSLQGEPNISIMQELPDETLK